VDVDVKIKVSVKTELGAKVPLLCWDSSLSRRCLSQPLHLKHISYS